METYGLFLRLFGQNDEHVEDRGLKKKRKKDLRNRQPTITI